MVLYKYTCCCLSVSEERVDVCLSLPQYQEASPLTLYCDNKGQSRTISRKRSYRVSSIRCWGCLLHISVQLLSKGGIYFSGKPTDINDSWIRYVRAIQRWLHIRCYMQPLSSTVSNGKELYNMSSSSASLVMVVRIICTRVHVPHIVVAAAFRGRHLVEEIRYPIKLMFYFGVCKTFVATATKNLTSRELKPGTFCISVLAKSFSCLNPLQPLSNLIQEIQFLEFMVGSNSTHAHSNYLICMCSIR